MTRTRTPRPLYQQLDGPAIYPACLVGDCSRAGVHDRLCYTHLAESRRKLIVEHRRLQRHHRALTDTARRLVDVINGSTVDLNVARATKALQRLLRPDPS